MEINIKSIPHNDMRFSQIGEGGIGDWWDENGATQIRVSEMDVWIYKRLIAIHELIEDTLVKLAGIDGKWYDQWCDKEGILLADEMKNPIAKQHETATICERIVAQAAGVDFRVYEDYIEWFIKNQKGNAERPQPADAD